MNTEFAASIAREFAEYLNSRPEEAKNWGPLERGSDIPECDHISLRNHYLYSKREPREIDEVEKAYIAAFNAAFAAG